MSLSVGRTEYELHVIEKLISFRVCQCGWLIGYRILIAHSSLIHGEFVLELNGVLITGSFEPGYYYCAFRF